MIHHRGLIKSRLQRGREGGLGFFILATEERQSQQKSLFCLQWKVKVRRGFVFSTVFLQVNASKVFSCLVSLEYLQRMIYRRVELRLAFLTHLCFRDLCKVKCLDAAVFHRLLMSIIWSVLCFRVRLQIRHLFHICTLLKALNRLIIDIISKCHPL